mgnify:CR=1 FL=1
MYAPGIRFSLIVTIYADGGGVFECPACGVVREYTTSALLSGALSDHSTPGYFGACKYADPAAAEALRRALAS